MGLMADTLDELLIAPCMTRLYHQAARWNQAPRLAHLLSQGKPIYPQMKRAPALDPADAWQDRLRDLWRWLVMMMKQWAA